VGAERCHVDVSITGGSGCVDEWTSVDIYKTERLALWFVGSIAEIGRLFEADVEEGGFDAEGTLKAPLVAQPQRSGRSQ